MCSSDLSHAILREHHWQNAEPIFDVKNHRHFLESQTTHRVDQISLRTIVMGIYHQLHYSQLCFYPTDRNGRGAENIHLENRNAFNMFLGFRVWRYLEEDYKDFSKVEIILKHFREVYFYNDGNTELQEEGTKWFVHWLAKVFCEPWRRSEKLPIFVSKVGGVGKSCFFQWLINTIFGSMYAEEVTSQHQLNQRFNARSRFLILRFIDDMMKKVDTKAISTSKYLRIEHKNIDHVDCGALDFSNIAMAANTYRDSGDPGDKGETWLLTVGLGTHQTHQLAMPT